MRRTALYISNSTFYKNNGSSSPGSAAVVAIQCHCIGIIDSNFENNLAIGLIILSTQGNCEKHYSYYKWPYPPLFDLSTIPGNEDSYLNQYMQDTELGWSTTVDIRKTTMKGNTDSTFLQTLSSEAEAVALALQGEQA